MTPLGLNLGTRHPSGLMELVWAPGSAPSPGEATAAGSGLPSGRVILAGRPGEVPIPARPPPPRIPGGTPPAPALALSATALPAQILLRRFVVDLREFKVSGPRSADSSGRRARTWNGRAPAALLPGAEADRGRRVSVQCEGPRRAGRSRGSPATARPRGGAARPAMPTPGARGRSTRRTSAGDALAPRPPALPEARGHVGRGRCPGDAARCCAPGGWAACGPGSACGGSVPAGPRWAPPSPCSPRAAAWTGPASAG